MSISFEYAEGGLALNAPRCRSDLGSGDVMFLGGDDSKGLVSKACEGGKAESRLRLGLSTKNVLFVISQHWGQYPTYKMTDEDWLTYEAVLEGSYYAIICGRQPSTDPWGGHVFSPVTIYKTSSLSILRKKPVASVSPGPQPASASMPSNNNSGKDEIYCNNTPKLMQSGKDTSGLYFNVQPSPSMVDPGIVSGSANRRASRVFIIAPLDMPRGML